MTDERPGRRVSTDFLGEDRGLSVAVNYTLSLVIVAMLMSGLFMSMSSVLVSEREQTVQGEFDVLGNRVAADISAADQLASTTGGSGSVEIHTTIPSQVAGTDYLVQIASVAVGDYYLVVIEFESRQVAVTREITVKTQHEVATASFSGEDYVIEFVGGKLEVRSDG